MSDSSTAALNSWSIDLANSYGGLSLNPDPDPGQNYHNDQYDAYRHALVSAELTRLFGETFAKNKMDQHEKNVPNPAAEDNMDRWNNSVGRSEYQKWREATKDGRTTDTLEKWIYDRVKEGKTINNLNDPRKYKEPPSHKVNPNTNTNYNNGKKFRPRDPLTFDIDGDGIESTGININTPILFDHDGDGIKNATGWIKADDGILVLDRNGNGTIDSGRELFGDNTIKSNGQKATDGFDALADLDSNSDGIINSSDTQFANLRLWRDLNQDGISQIEELFTLSDLGISSINVASVAHNQTLPNGNEIGDLGTYTKTDGSTGTVGSVTGTVANVNLADETFYREFPDQLDTSAVSTLPDMQGSGAVRDLLEAATQSATLQTLLTQYSAATTRIAQLGLIDQLLDAWADTSGYAETLDDRVAAMPDAHITMGAMEWVVPYYVRYEAIGNLQRIETSPFGPGTISSGGGGGGGGTISINHEGPEFPDVESDWLSPEFKAAIAEWDQKIHILEAFNGNHFFGLPGTTQDLGASTGLTIRAAPPDGGGGGTISVITSWPISISYAQGQLDLLQQSYDALKESVYDALVLQTRLKPLLDQIDLVIDNNSISLDFSAVQNTFETKIAQNSAVGVADLIEFNRASRDILYGTGWQGYDLLETQLKTLPLTPSLQAVYSEFHVNVDAGASYTVTGTAKNDVIVGAATVTSQINGGAGNDVIYAGVETNYIDGGEGDDYLIAKQANTYLSGGSGNDILVGKQGNDTLYGDDGDDTLEGGAGNDNLNGGYGSDTYVFGLGSGQDTINNNSYGELTNKVDQIDISSLSLSDVTIRRESDDLIIGVNGSLDTLRISSYFYQDGANTYGYTVDKINLADVTLEFADIRAATLIPSVDGDTIIGYETNDNMTGLEGNDNISGRGGDDTLDGGDGRDYLAGEAGNDSLNGGIDADTLDGGLGDDVLQGQDGNDTLYGDVGNDTLDGGAGNDQLTGGDGADVYKFGIGSGQDIINNYDNDTQGTNADTVLLGAGITTTGVTLTRSGDSLFININGKTDRLEVANYFIEDGVASYAVENIKFADNTVWNLATVKTKVLTGTLNNDNLIGFESNDTINGSDGQDTISGRGGNDSIDGGAGNDFINADNGNDVVNGGAGNDTIFGDTGNDTLDGGAGNDVLTGGDGADTYKFGIGSGQDTINNYDSDAQGTNADTILLGAGITTTGVTLTRSGDSLYIAINGKSDKLEVANYFTQDGGAPYAVENIKFADNTVWNLATVKTKVLTGTVNNDDITGFESNDTINGLEGQDTISGRGGNDTINGGAGNDNIYAEAGNDSILGGSGNDNLYGDAGNDILDGGNENDALNGGDGADTYKFGIGYGQDTISNYDSDVQGANADTILLGAGIATTGVTLTRSSDSLFISINGTNDRLEVTNYFYLDGTSTYTVENIKFADNTVWNLATVKSKVLASTLNNDNITGFATNDTIASSDGNDLVSGQAGNDTIDGGTGNDYLNGDIGNDSLTGGTGNDYLSGGAGNDVLDGGVGNDILSGDDGADTYKFGIGSGQDTINNYDSDNLGTNADTILLGAGIATTGVTLTRGGDSLFININGTNDTLEVQNYFYLDGVSNYAIENLKFADNTVWSVATIKTKVLAGTINNDNITGFASNDTINGSDGRDVISGLGGNDIIDGGTGADSIYAGDGNDSITGGTGSDNLYGEAGNDTLDGGAGNDQLNGGDGADTYKFGTGSGQDSIYNYDNDSQGTNVDTILLGAGITTTGVKLTRQSDSLYVTINGTADVLEVVNYFNEDGASTYTVENIKFADNTIWNYATVLTKLSTATPPTGSTINGTTAAQTHTGTAGNDTIYGNAGNDTLDGAAGNDYLNGGDGADTYKFGIGSGQDSISNYDSDAQGANADTILLGTGIATTGVTLTRSGDNLYIAINGKSDKLEVIGYFSEDGITPYAVENIKFADNTIWNLATVKTKVTTGTTADDSMTAFASNDTLTGLGGDDTIYGQAGNDTIDGGADVDLLFGGDGDDSITGGTGADTLYGDAGNDVFDGGAGNDFLNGGDGADTYKFGTGSGYDTINNYDSDTQGTNIDTILLGTGVTTTGVTLTRSGDSLFIAITGKSDRLEVTNYFSEDGASPYAVENIKFADNTIWDVATVKSKLITGTVPDDAITGYATNDTINGLAGIDTIYGQGGDDLIDGGTDEDRLFGGDGNDSLTGGTGNDTLYGDAGNDTLDGSAGNDILYGGDGADVYKFGIGSGQDSIGNYDADAQGTNADTILLGAGITTTGVTLTRIGDSLFIAVNGKSDRLEVSSYFYEDGASTYAVENIKFADNTIWDVATVKSKVITGTASDDSILAFATNDTLNGLAGSDSIYGQAGNDTIDGGADGDLLFGGEGNDSITGGSGADVLYGDAGNDTLDGGSGTDTLNGSDGADIYKFGTGSGQDVINNYDSDTQGTNTDTILLGTGITTTGVTLTRSSDSLYITINGTNDRLEVANYFSDDGVSPYAVENIKFADNTVWSVTTVKAKVIAGSANNDYINAFASNDNLTGLAGNDNINGQAGNDTMDGGADEDTLSGGDGNDVINGGTGIDTLYGDAGNDTLDGGAGNDYLNAGDGADTYKFGTGSGQDTINNYDSDEPGTNADTILLGAGITTTGVTLTRSSDSLFISINGTNDSLEVSNFFNQDANSPYAVENLKFADNTIWDVATIKAKVTIATSGDDILTGYASNDSLSGGTGNDTIYGKEGNDIVTGGVGEDRLHGDDGDDLLQGGTQGDWLYDGAGNDILQGQEANDWLTGDVGNNVLDGGAGNDTVTSYSGHNLAIGGKGSDTVNSYNGYDVIAFNKGDGQDTLSVSPGPGNTISLGNGANYAEMSFSKSGSDLILKTSVVDQVVLTGWYYNPNSIANLQVIAEAMEGFNATGTNTLLDNKVETFDFAGLVGRFDQALAADPTVSNWALSNALLDFHLGGSDTAAIGGDLAYQYGKTGSLTGIGLNAAQGVINDTQFGQSAQTLNNPTVWQAEVVKLA